MDSEANYGIGHYINPALPPLTSHGPLSLAGNDLHSLLSQLEVCRGAGHCRIITTFRGQPQSPCCIPVTSRAARMGRTDQSLPTPAGGAHAFNCAWVPCLVGYQAAMRWGAMIASACTGSHRHRVLPSPFSMFSDLQWGSCMGGEELSIPAVLGVVPYPSIPPSGTKFLEWGVDEMGPRFESLTVRRTKKTAPPHTLLHFPTARVLQSLSGCVPDDEEVHFRPTELSRTKGHPWRWLSPPEHPKSVCPTCRKKHAG